MILKKKLYRKVGMFAEIFLSSVQRGMAFVSFSLKRTKHDQTKTQKIDEKKIDAWPMLIKKEDENGQESLLCNGCMLCQINCPSSAIHIIPYDGNILASPPQTRQALSFELEVLRCVNCRQCVEICPINAIKFTTHDYFSAGDMSKEWMLDHYKLIGE
ncbi:MAG: hypothetical protein A2504_16350 [Bdellovibrionales bacterium RIFOXYD12_FULL_39_22]|nr:MAG: hypothetical protein A2385_10005 [Bdellovibrionales bacterium RIFOXYB1_FULL_39_21]OFZ45434.1 MAG: hypothetical protein A2404_01250 [Bdellovibrionales bacterium RIFOXYC1_FULL_39_130]OFZ74637.1 MAG: hypothetical protein A2560_09575 [Bdellovibrionales bacterium RIFOXYD1_FULL_39_84]OFZ92946.1 MAG: hypothetical protein A2504_16350 [Bdellovibrionales bacterium RIFOXYD12_FULL_39_22]HLE12797.1 4Fe-4S dicluster domain-containing protein [Bacteriovoracaceae bacterium]